VTLDIAGRRSCPPGKSPAPQALAAIAGRRPRRTPGPPRIFAAARTAVFMYSPGGVARTISPTPAARAGNGDHRTVEGYAAGRRAHKCPPVKPPPT
jgi:hypothetical protein